MYGKINGPLLLLAYLQFLVFVYASFWVGFLFTLGKTFVLIFGIEYNTRHKAPICTDVIIRENYPWELNWHVVQTVSIEYLLVTSLFSQSSYWFGPETALTTDLLWFIPTAFAFELVFDFFHYWAHRGIHESPWLYRHVHKKHHSHRNVNCQVTFYEEPSELVLTNVLPTVVTLMILPPMSKFMFSLILIYKEYIEICGHVGKKCYPSSSFPQCIWLPKWFGIELYSEDHFNHHYHLTCNYAKRFALWDQLFGTRRLTNY